MSTTSPALPERLTKAQTEVERLRAEVRRVILGQDAVLEEVLLATLASGHVLLEGAPGLGKTLLIRTLAACLELDFTRIQFTPDLMPSDITGNDVLLLDEHGNSTGRFELHRGPVFTQVLLADEINRASPRTQSALLEAMQESSVTIAGRRHALTRPFMVFATENPIEMEGTYPLPEAQLDRFLFKILVPAPSEHDLERILEATTGHQAPEPERVLPASELLALQAACRDVAVPRAVLRYATRLTAATDPGAATAPELVRRAVRFGAGVRGGQALILGAKARALIAGRANAGFEDVRAVAKPALRHRLHRSFEGEADGVNADDVIDTLLREVAELPPEIEREIERAPERTP